MTMFPPMLAAKGGAKQTWQQWESYFLPICFSRASTLAFNSAFSFSSASMSTPTIGPSCFFKNLQTKQYVRCNKIRSERDLDQQGARADTP